MPQPIKYIGESQTIKGASLNPQNINDWPEIELEKDKIYNIDIQYDGPQMIVNGQQVFDPNATFWVVLENGRIAYAKNCLERYWDIKI